VILRGILYLVGAEFCFCLSTVFAKFVNSTTSISGIEIVFFRFFFGFLLSLLYILKSGETFRPNRWDLVFWRGFFNTVSVIFFFLSVQYTTVTNANMLNMTYPAYIFLVAPFINKEKSSPLLLVFLVLTMIGVYLVINPDFHHIHIGDLYGMCSGMTAAFAVTTLRKARGFDSPAIILFYMMGVGVIINLICMIPIFIVPHGMAAINIIISALMGVLGQYFITTGYLYISASGGGLVSSSRIVFATALGAILFGEAITLRTVAGGLCILVSIIGIVLFTRDKRANNEKKIVFE